MAKTSETRKFDAEIGKVLQLMIHSLYTNKDIFIRELISNASDACDKRRYESLNNAELQSTDAYKIQIIVDKNQATLRIVDNGIGMNYDDMVNNLGMIAGSGTQKFMQSVNDNAKVDLSLIGQFGVGFYSAYMVADEVTVISHKVGEKKAYRWYSTGDNSYEIGETKEKHDYGTTILLKLKPAEIEYLEKYRLKHIISTYSDHISFPIELIDEEGHAETVNTASALWVRPKNEISENQYKEFYHHVSHLPDNPWMRIHTKAEGNIEYTSLLYVPSVKPFDLFHPDRKTRVKLYVKKVFITEDSVKLIPEYMRFMRGVVDSEDLPLNISRETLQNNSVIDKIRKSLVKKILAELKIKAKNEPEAYAEFWKNFGEVMKEGLCEGALEEKEQLLEVCRFYTTKAPEGISLDEYIDRMVDGQEEIYYLTGDHLEGLKNHPQLEGFVGRDIEVLLLGDNVDDFWVNVINQYKNNSLKSANAPDIELEKIKHMTEHHESTEEEKVDNSELLSFIKEVLGDRVKEVIKSHKLVGSPACLSVPSGHLSIRMERYLLAQKQLKKASAKIFEVNPEHAILKRIAKNLNKEVAKDLVYIIYDQACILEGEELQDPAAFANRLNKLIA